MTSRIPVPARRAGWLVLALLLVLAACGGSSGSADGGTDASSLPDDVAARVGGDDIARADLEAEVSTLVANQKFLDSFSGGSTPIVDSDGRATDSTRAVWLTTLVQQAVVDAAVADRGLDVTDANRAEARQSFEQNFGGTDVVGAWPQDFVDTLVGRGARVAVLRDAIAGPAPTEAEQRQFYADNLDAIKASCASGMTVAHILVDTKQEADAIESQLADGADFATLAAAHSTDTGSKDQGGALGCYTAGQYVQAFDDAVKAATPGTPTAPVQTQYGWHVILVDDTDPTSFERMQPQIEQAMTNDARSQATRQITDMVGGADVTVNPRYGTWVVDDQGARVEPPGATTTTTTAPAAGGTTSQPTTGDSSGGDTPATDPSSTPASG